MIPFYLPSSKQTKIISNKKTSSPHLIIISSDSPCIFPLLCLPYPQIFSLGYPNLYFIHPLPLIHTLIVFGTWGKIERSMINRRLFHGGTGVSYQACYISQKFFLLGSHFLYHFLLTKLIQTNKLPDIHKLSFYVSHNKTTMWSYPHLYDGIRWRPCVTIINYSISSNI